MCFVRFVSNFLTFHASSKSKIIPTKNWYFVVVAVVFSFHLEQGVYSYTVSIQHPESHITHTHMINVCLSLDVLFHIVPGHPIRIHLIDKMIPIRNVNNPHRWMNEWMNETTDEKKRIKHNYNHCSHSKADTLTLAHVHIRTLVQNVSNLFGNLYDSQRDT